jgi:hypothetical protein
MKKITIALFLMTAVSVAGMKAQNQQNINLDIAPNLSPVTTAFGNERALWDIQFNYNTTTAAAGDAGMAGAIYFNNEFWVSRWQNDTMYRFSATGVLNSEFVMAGLTGARSLTTDGTFIYAGANTNTIYKIDPTLQQLAPPHITINASIGVNARFCTYDATLNSGAGGFWIGNFTTDIIAVDMSGNQLSSIPAASHGLTGMYGAAVDNFTAGGPYLWVFDQSGTSTTTLYQLNVSTGAQTGLVHDVMSDVGLAQGLSSGLAGGMFISNQVVPTQVTIGGIIQGTPSNVLFGYELTNPVTSINELNHDLFSVYPNPVSDLVTVNYKGVEKNTTYVIYDLAGKVVLTGTIQNENTSVNVSSIASGSYLLDILSNSATIGKKLIIKN